MNLNKVFIAGRLTADPELRTTQAGDQVASFSVASNRFWRDKDGQKKESTEFHNVVVWGRQAEVVNQFSKKGSIILVEGRLQTRAWEGKDGQTRRTTEIVAENIQLGPRGGGGSFDQERSTPSADEQDQSVEDKVPSIDIEDESSSVNPDDLPF